jgi:hypothetical protein
MGCLLFGILKRSVSFLLLVLLPPAYSQVLTKPVKVDAGEKAFPQKAQTMQEKLIGICTTDNAGKCSLSFAPEASAQYQAYAPDEAGNMILASNIIIVSVDRNFSLYKAIKPGIAPGKNNKVIKIIR